MANRLIMYTDIFDDSDDAAALYASTRAGSIDLRLVVTTCDDARTKAAGTKQFLRLAGRPGVEVRYGKGVSTDDGNFRMQETAYDFVAGLPLSSSDGELGINPGGVAYAADEINLNPGSYTLLSLAPLTDVAETLKSADPKKLKRVFLMGGHVGQYDESPNAPHHLKKRPDHNFRLDINAARDVLSSGAEIYIVGKNVGGYRWLTLEDFEPLSSGNEAQRELFKMIKQRDRHMKNVLPAGVEPVILMYDLVALGAMALGQYFDFRRVEIDTDEKGLTHTKLTNSGNVRGVVGADLPRLKKKLLDLLMS
ncbi:MAG: nucleoside hydrolase [Candidatus Aenigmarchaeota archaeon]|nr:nucleoside hydrolase [Candidatus Aenigmarchaeota archaeon]